MFAKKYAPVGSRPGTLVITEGAPAPTISVIHYTKTEVEEFVVSNEALLSEGDAYSKLLAFSTDPNSVTWIDIQGMGREDVLLKVGEIFNLHVLTLADVVNTPQRAKAEAHDNYALHIGAMISFDSERGFVTEQLSVLWTKSHVMTFQERIGDILDPVRERIRKGLGPIRKSKADYLAYAIIDTVVDGYYPVLEQIGEQLEDLEDRIVMKPSEEVLREVYRNKRELLGLRRSIWPEREAISSLVREGNPFVEKSTRLFFRDTYEHVVQVIDVVEAYRELVGSFMDVYLSSVSNRMNEVMKVLTIMGSIFIPLSFLAGVFGMNFEYMPELKYRWAYPVFWLVIIISAGSMLWYFRGKGWIGNSDRSDDEQ